MFEFVRDGVQVAIQAVINALGAAINGIISAWPIGMPELPVMPEEFGEYFGWVKWSPLPIAAAFAFFVFCVSVWLAWMLVAPMLRWGKIID